MDVIVDGAQNFAVEGNPADALAVVSAANEWLRERGRALQAVIVDGNDLSPDALNATLEGRSLDSITTLEIQSEAVSVLVDKCLDELKQYVPELAEACRSLALVFQGEAPQEGFEPFQQLASIWRIVKERQLMVARNLDLDLDTFTIEGSSFQQLHEELNGYLQEAADALQAEDMVLLGDLLEYELAPRAERESAIVAVLQEQALAQQAG